MTWAQAEPLIKLTAIIGFMAKKLAKECPDVDYRFGGDGLHDKKHPLCHNPEVIANRQDEVIYLCPNEASAAVEVKPGDCARCNIYLK